MGAQTAFKNTWATTLGAGVSASDITITDITAAARRRLSTSRRLSAGIDIKYTVAVADEAVAEPDETGHDGHDHGGGGGGVNPASKASASALVSAVALAISCAMLS